MVLVALYSCHVTVGSEASLRQRLASLSAGRIKGCHNEGWGVATLRFNGDFSGQTAGIER